MLTEGQNATSLRCIAKLYFLNPILIDEYKFFPRMMWLFNCVSADTMGEPYISLCWVRALYRRICQAIRPSTGKIRLILKKKTAGDESCGLSNRPLMASFVPQTEIVVGKSWREECAVNPA